MKKQLDLINEKIPRVHSDVLVIGPEGEQFGVMTGWKAFNRAKDLGLDLLLVNGNNNPAVCKIVDYGKLTYQKEHKEKPFVPKLKEVKISPNIGQNDFNTMYRRAKEFLTKKHNLKLTCVFRGRELNHPELGEAKMKQMVELLVDVGIPVGEMSLSGKFITVVLNPL